MTQNSAYLTGWGSGSTTSYAYEQLLIYDQASLRAAIHDPTLSADKITSKWWPTLSAVCHGCRRARDTRPVIKGNELSRNRPCCLREYLLFLLLYGTPQVNLTTPTSIRRGEKSCRPRCGLWTFPQDLPLVYNLHINRVSPKQNYITASCCDTRESTSNLVLSTGHLTSSWACWTDRSIITGR